MARSPTSPERDNTRLPSNRSDNPITLWEQLRSARRDRNLTQQALADKVGFHQRQISDLERATVDPRLSTIQNVARALDLELMLIPRHLISAAEGLLRAGTDAAKRPMYSLDDDKGEDEYRYESKPEVGQDQLPVKHRTRRVRR